MEPEQRKVLEELIKEHEINDTIEQKTRKISLLLKKHHLTDEEAELLKRLQKKDDSIKVLKQN